jgi:hypothetical protein
VGVNVGSGVSVGGTGVSVGGGGVSVAVAVTVFVGVAADVAVLVAVLLGLRVGVGVLAWVTIAPFSAVGDATAAVTPPPKLDRPGVGVTMVAEPPIPPDAATLGGAYRADTIMYAGTAHSKPRRASTVTSAPRCKSGRRTCAGEVSATCEASASSLFSVWVSGEGEKSDL